MLFFCKPQFGKCNKTTNTIPFWRITNLSLDFKSHLSPSSIAFTSFVLIVATPETLENRQVSSLTTEIRYRERHISLEIAMMQGCISIQNFLRYNILGIDTVTKYIKPTIVLQHHSLGLSACIASIITRLFQTVQDDGHMLF